MSNQKTEIETQPTIQVQQIVMRRLVEKWEAEMNKLWDEWQWCLEHKFPLDAQLKYELKEQLRRKIFELEDRIKGT